VIVPAKPPVLGSRSKSGLEPTGDCDGIKCLHHLPVDVQSPNQDSSRQAIVTFSASTSICNSLAICPNQDSSRQAIVTLAQSLTVMPGWAAVQIRTRADRRL